MKRFALALILLAAFTGAWATDMVAKSGGDVIRLSDSPCMHAGTLALIKPEHRKLFKNARAQIGGKDFYACWAMDGRQMVYVIFEDGDMGLLDPEDFKPDDGS